MLEDQTIDIDGDELPFEEAMQRLTDPFILCGQYSDETVINMRDSLKLLVDRVKELETHLSKGCEDELDLSISEGGGHVVCGLADKLMESRQNWMKGALLSYICIKGGVCDEDVEAMCAVEQAKAFDEQTLGWPFKR